MKFWLLERLAVTTAICGLLVRTRAAAPERVCMPIDVESNTNEKTVITIPKDLQIECGNYETYFTWGKMGRYQPMFYGIDVFPASGNSMWRSFRRMNDFKKLKTALSGVTKVSLDIVENEFPRDTLSLEDRPRALEIWLSKLIKNLNEEDAAWGRHIKAFLDPYSNLYRQYRDECSCVASVRMEDGCKKTYDDYDVILSIESVRKMIDSRCTDLTTAKTSDFNINTSPVNVVGILGLFDKGKTWFLNKLFGVNFGSSKLFTTVGMSMFYYKNEDVPSYLIIDSAGVQQPISYKAHRTDSMSEDDLDEMEKEEYVDRSQTEALVFELVSNMSDILIFLVNDFTWLEQRMLYSLHYTIAEKQQHWKSLAVVHNLKSETEPKDFEEHFRKQVEQHVSSPHEEKKDGSSIYDELLVVEGQQKNTYTFKHFGLAKEGSDAGKKHNEVAFREVRKFIKDEMKRIGAYMKPLRLVERLASDVSTLLGSFANILGNESLVDENIKVSFERLDETHARLNMASNDIGTTIEQKKKGIVNEFGQIQVVETRFRAPKPIETTKIDEHGRKSHVWMFEIPGVTQENIKYKCPGPDNACESDAVCLEITREKLPSISVGAESVHGARINYKSGKFVMGIRIPEELQEYTIHCEDGDFMTYEDGILSVYAEENTDGYIASTR